MLRSTLIALLCLLLYTYLPAQRSYVFATYTYSTNNRLQNLEPLAAWLSAETGLPVRAVSYPTVAALIRAIEHDSVDVAMMNTSGYLLLQRTNPEKVEARVNLRMGDAAKTSYGGCLIARNASGLTSIDNLKNATDKPALALVSPSSTSGNLVPRLLLNSYGLMDAEKQFSVAYAGAHRKVVEEVLSGRAALGGCGCAEVDSARKNMAFSGKAVVIDSFDNIPLGPVVFRKTLDRRVTNALTKKLLELARRSPEIFARFCEGWTEFRQATAFQPVSDKNYDAFRRMFGKNMSLWKMIE